MLRAKRRRRSVLLGHVDERGDGSDDLRDGGKQLEEKDPPHHGGKVGYWDLSKGGVIRRHYERSGESVIDCAWDSRDGRR